MKKCSKCKDIKDLKDFYADYKSSDNKKSHCKDCDKKEGKIYRDANKNKRRDSDYQRKYGITLHTYNTMYDYQDGVCDICGRSQDKNLAIDHNHDTGSVRGLLCDTCNRGIGFLQDDTDILSKAIIYLNKHK